MGHVTATDSREKHRRVLLKLSGEALKSAGGDSALGLDAAVDVARMLGEIQDRGIQLAVVLGAGNLFRGRSATDTAIERVSADYVGMLGTMMNALAVAAALRSLGRKVLAQSAFPIPGVIPPFDAREARNALEHGAVVLFAGGTGHPFFTTDTTAALRAAEIHADLLLKGTKVDGVFSADPEKYADAVRYRTLSYADAIQERLEVMDAAAFSLCLENRIPIVVFNYGRAGALGQALDGDLRHATYVGDVPTETVSVSLAPPTE